MNYFPMKLPFLLSVVILMMTSCYVKGQNTVRLPVEYNLNKPEVIKLTKEIDQISGIVCSATDNGLYAIDDDNGDLYHIALTKETKITKWKFGKNADYEDLVLVDGFFYVLESSGKIIRFPSSFPITDANEYSLDIKNRNEFESLYYDSDNRRLMMLCKQCKEDNADMVSAYSIDINTNSFDSKPAQQLSRKQIEQQTQKKTGRLKFSAANVNPLNGYIYMLSSINKLLVVTDKNYNVKATYKLDKKLFHQPEGICFAADGTMYISNEASSGKESNILIFRRL